VQELFLYTKKKVLVADVEPRAASGNIADSHRFHARISLPVDLSLSLTRGASVRIDDRYCQADSDGNIRLKIPAGSHYVEAYTPIYMGSGERDVFERWSDGSTEAKRNLILPRPSSYSATYKKQYYLNVTSPIVKVGGSGWYDAGSTVNIAMPATSVPMYGWLGTLGGKIVFDHWRGDLYSRESSTTIKMDSPKTVEAKWREDYTIPIFTLITICGGLGGTSIIAFKHIRAKRKATTKAAPQIQVQPTPQPTTEERTPPKDEIISEYKQLSSELQKIEQKLTKLKDAYANSMISDEIYKTLLTEYEKKAQDLKRLVDEAESKIKSELAKLQDEESKIKKDLEILNAKQIIEEISETEYLTEKSILDAKLTEIQRKKSSLTYRID